MKKLFRATQSFLFSLLLLFMGSQSILAQSFKIVDTGQTVFYNNQSAISEPQPGTSFYGQDASFSGHQPDYTDNGDGTVTDNVTGLMWQQSTDLNGDGVTNVNDKLSQGEAEAGADTFRLAGYDDWRLPTIKEAYSLFMFTGEDPSGYEGTDTEGLTPFVDTDYFDVAYGDTDAGERIIDGQYASTTLYVGTTMNGDATMFGVNFVDGRIKGYPTGPMPGQTEDKQFYVLYVRGNEAYGINDFVDNSDGTVSDVATGLMWMQDDSQIGMDWEAALEYAQTKNAENYLGHNDWRVPDAKELHSILDYSRSPQTTNSAAIDPVFTCTAITDEGGDQNYASYWSSSTHANMNNGAWGAYVCFGEALGFMEEPFPPFNVSLLDVHGAGAQRSDPKAGDADDYPQGHGPQGDVVRIDNFVRLVRDIQTSTGLNENPEIASPNSFSLEQNYPNPFNPSTSLVYNLSQPGNIRIAVYNTIGQEVTQLYRGFQETGKHQIVYNADGLSSGVYFVVLEQGATQARQKIVLLK